ncbi:MAG: hypothetical protein QXN29_04695 [Thermofilaceae archaeon]
MFKPPEEVYRAVSRFELYYSYPYVYYFAADPLPRFSELPVKNGVQVQAYCIRVSRDRILVVQAAENSEVAVVDLLDASLDALRRVDSPRAVSEAIDRLIKFLTSGEGLDPTPHEVRGIGVLFSMSHSEVEKAVERAKLVRMLEDRYVAVVNEMVFVFSRNPAVVFARFEGQEAVRVAEEKSLVAKSPISEMREHLFSFLDGERDVTVFAGSNSSILCTRKDCFPLNVPLNLLKLILRDPRVNPVYVDVTKPETYRRTKLAVPGHVVIAGQHAKILKCKDETCEVVKEIRADVHAGSPLLFTTKGFGGYASMVAEPGGAVRISVHTKPRRKPLEVEEYERTAVAL